MALTERLALLVTLDANGAIKGLESVGKAADRNLGRAESKIDRTAQKFQKAGAGMLAGAGLAAAGLFKAGQSAADLEQAIGGTEAVFKDASGTIAKFAKDSARSMGLSERAFREATTSIGGQLKGLGFREDEAAEKAIELTGVASDLAATFGGTTADAVQALGAAFRGEADPAERFNLRLNQNTVNAKAVALGLAESTSQVDAQAKAQATLALITEQSADAQGQFAREAGSASGAMQIANAELENAKAALGQSVAPIIAEVAGGLADLAGGFSRVNEASGGLVSKFATFATVGLGAAGGLSLVVGKAIQLRDSIKDIPNRIGDLGSSLGKFKGPAAIAAAGAGLLGVALFKTQQRAESMRQAARELADEAEATGKTLEEVAVEKLARTFAESDQVTRAMKALSLSFEDLRDPLTGSSEEFDDWKDALLRANDASTGLQDEAGALVGRVERLRSELGKAEQVTSRTAEANKALGIATDDTADAADGLNGKLQDQKDTAEALTDALGELLDATLAQFDSNLSYRRSVDSVEDSIAELLEVQKEHGTNTEEYRDQLLDAESAALDVAAAAVRLAEDQAKANGETLTAADKNRVYVTELGKVRDTLKVGSPLRDAIETYIFALASVPDTVATKLQADASGAFRTVNEFLRYLDTIGVKTPTGYTLKLGFKQDQLLAPSGSSSSSSPTRSPDLNANGTSFFGGGLTWVGERGPELVSLPRGSQVYDANTSAQMAGGVTTANIYITTAADPQAVVEAVDRYIRRNVKPSWAA